jgi:hypothetical protein
MNWTDTTIAFMAAIIDGEGSITIEKQGPGNCTRRKYDSYSLRLVVVNTNVDLMEWLINNFGGTIHKRKLVPNRKQCYTWRTTYKESSEIIKLCAPYFIVKRKHAILYLKFIATINDKHGNRFSLSDEVKEEREKLYLALKVLNKQGPTDNNPT